MMNLDRIGKYRVVAKIGQGAMGEVYKAHDPLLNRYVAIKTISPALAADPRVPPALPARGPVGRPAQPPQHRHGLRVRRRRRPHLHGDGAPRGRRPPRGDPRDARSAPRPTSSTSWSRSATASPSRTRAASSTATSSPATSTSSRAARSRSSTSASPGSAPSEHDAQTGTVMGTPHYMSPEQVRGQKADARSDVFSLGAVFYEILSHHRPFEADSVHGVLFQILEHEPEPIRKWAPDVPAAARRRSSSGRSPRTPPTATPTPARWRAPSPTRATRSPARRSWRTPGGPRPRCSRPATRPWSSRRRPPRVRGATALTLARPPARARRRASAAARSGPIPPSAGGPATQAPPAPGPPRALVLGGAAVAPRRRRGGRGRCGCAGGARPRRRERPGRPGAGEPDGRLSSRTRWSSPGPTSPTATTRRRRGARRTSSRSPRRAPTRGRCSTRPARRSARSRRPSAEARGAFGRGDTSRGLRGPRPRDGPRPPAPRRSASSRRALNQHFRPQAEDGRRQADAARKAAEERGRRRSPGSRRARSSSRRRRRSSASRTSPRPRRSTSSHATPSSGRSGEADEARAAAARPSPSAPRRTHAAPRHALASRRPRPRPRRRRRRPPRSPCHRRRRRHRSPRRRRAAPPPIPATPRSAGSEAEVRRVIAEYGRAMADPRPRALPRPSSPSLSADGREAPARGLQGQQDRSASASPSSPCRSTGDRATVRATRQDVIDGRPTKAVRADLPARRASARTWQIQ